MHDVESHTHAPFTQWTPGPQVHAAPVSPVEAASEPPLPELPPELLPLLLPLPPAPVSDPLLPASTPPPETGLELAPLHAPSSASPTARVATAARRSMSRHT